MLTKYLVTLEINGIIWHIYNVLKSILKGGVFLKRVRNKEETVKKILQAAREVFAQKGYDGTTIDDIVKTINYTKGAFYCHFNSKEELFLELIDLRVEEHQKTFQELLNPKLPIEHNITNVFSYIVNITKQDKWVPLFFEFLCKANTNANIKKRMEKMYNNWIFFLSAVLQRLQDNGKISQGLDKEFTASLIIAIFDGFNVQASLNSTRFDQQKIINLLVQMLKKEADTDSQLEHPSPH